MIDSGSSGSRSSRSARGAGLPRTLARLLGFAVAAAVAAQSASASAASGPVQATLGSAYPVTETTATLTGTVSAPHVPFICRFEWGVTTPSEAGAQCVLEPFAPGIPVTASALATGLAPNTTYQWQLTASDGKTTGSSSIGSFHTEQPPATEGPYRPAPEEPYRPASEEPAPPPNEAFSPEPDYGPPPAAHKPAKSDPLDVGLLVAYCPAGADARVRASAAPKARPADANHTGWPPDRCLKMDKGTYGRSHTLVGEKHAHNYLLGGFGNDTIWGGNDGDVIWADYQPSGQSEHEHDRVHGGNGADWIYSSHGFSEIWTGAGDDHVALVYGHGVVHCNGPGHKTMVMRYLPQNRPWQLIGCSNMQIFPYKA